MARGNPTTRRFDIVTDSDRQTLESDAAKQSQQTANSTQNSQNSGSGVNKKPGKKPPGQEQNGTVLRYPYTAFQPGQDMVRISIFEYVKNPGINLSGLFDGAITESVTPGGEGEYGTTQITINPGKLTIPPFSYGFGQQSGNTQLKKNSRHIFLPIPQQVSDSLSVGYSEDTINPLDAAAVSATSDIIGGGGKSGQQIQDIVNSFVRNPGSVSVSPNGVTTEDLTALQTGLAAMVVNAAGRNVSPNALISRASGQILQSNLELLFSNVTLRSFPFVFDFAPRDELEADEVKRIIKTIKYAMAPSNGGNDTKGGLLLKAPDLFTFSYMSGKDNHPFLNRFKVGVLTDMKVNYTASGTYATYAGALKSPVHIRMQLTFKEINPVYKQDYEELGDAAPGVGY